MIQIWGKTDHIRKLSTLLLDDLLSKREFFTSHPMKSMSDWKVSEKQPENGLIIEFFTPILGFFQVFQQKAMKILIPATTLEESI